MKKSRSEKYAAKFAEMIGHWLTSLADRMSRFTPRERLLLDKMRKEEQVRRQTSVSFIIVMLKG